MCILYTLAFLHLNFQMQVLFPLLAQARLSAYALPRPDRVTTHVVRTERV